MNKDIIKKLNDFEYFAKKILKIRTKNNKVTQFIFNKEQQYIAHIIDKQKQNKNRVRLIILKGRQVGITTLVCAKAYHNLLINKNTKGLVLTHRQSATNNIFAIMHRYYLLSDAFFQPKLKINNNKLLQFPNLDSSFAFATAGSNEVGRSDTLQFFHGSEVAFWPNAENHLASIFMAVPDNNSEIILESTSRGFKGIFYDMCMEAINNKNSEYELVFLPWYWHVEYQLDKKINFSKEWLEYGKIHNLNKKQLAWAFEKNKVLNISANEHDKPCLRFYREFPATVNEAFKYSNLNNLIDLDKLKNRLLNPNDLFQNQDILTKFKQHQEIILGVDVARGGGDYSWIIDRQGDFLGFNLNEKVDFKDTMQIVAWVANHIKKYKPVAIYIDAGGGGVGVYDRLKELGYTNIHLIFFSAKSDNSLKYLNKRAQMWSLMSDLLNSSGYLINDHSLVQQLTAVEYYYNYKGQLQIEDKSNIKKKIKCSPDGADALALTFAGGLMHKQEIITQVNNNLHEFDPYLW